MNFMAVRNFKEATPLLLDTLSTFTATELLSYEDFVTLAAISAALTLERKDMKKKVIFYLCTQFSSPSTKSNCHISAHRVTRSHPNYPGETSLTRHGLRNSQHRI
jgi:hypothetical protein